MPAGSATEEAKIAGARAAETMARPLDMTGSYVPFEVSRTGVLAAAAPILVVTVCRHCPTVMPEVMPLAARLVPEGSSAAMFELSGAFATFTPADGPKL